MQQQKLKAIVEAAPININYLGEVSEKNLEKMIHDMEKLKKQLQHLKNQTRFTAFSSGEKMYIFQVSNVWKKYLWELKDIVTVYLLIP